MFGGGGGGGGMPNPFNMMFMPGGAGGPAGQQGQQQQQQPHPGQGGPGGFIDPFQILLGQADDRVLEQFLASGAFGGNFGGGFGQQQGDPDPRSQGPPPTAAATLRALPRVKVTKHDIEANESDECSICLDELVIGQPAIRIPCGHLYHEDCVKDWLKKSNECPVCRFELPTDDAEYERGRRMRMAGRKLRMRHSDLTVKSVQELQRLANFIDVDVRGCLEKSELVEKIAASSKVEIIKGADGADESSAASSGAAGQLMLSNAKLEAMSEKELTATMEQLGVDASDCSDKAQLRTRLILSGRILVVPDSEEERGARCSSAAPSAGSGDVPMPPRESAASPAPNAAGPPLAGRSIGELRQLARQLGISLDGCLEKGEIVARIAASPGFQG